MWLWWPDVRAKSHRSCPTLCDPIDRSPPGSSVHGILQARMLEWVAMPSSRGSSQPRDETQVSCIAGGFFTIWATREAHTDLRWALNPTWLMSFWEGGKETWEEHHVTIKAETGVMQFHAKKCQGWPVTTKSQERGTNRFSVRTSKGNQPCYTFILDAYPP